MFSTLPPAAPIGLSLTVRGGGVSGGDAAGAGQGDAGGRERARVQAAGGQHGRLARRSRDGCAARLSGTFGVLPIIGEKIEFYL